MHEIVKETCDVCENPGDTSWVGKREYNLCEKCAEEYLAFMGRSMGPAWARTLDFFVLKKEQK